MALTCDLDKARSFEAGHSIPPRPRVRVAGRESMVVLMLEFDHSFSYVPGKKIHNVFGVCATNRTASA
jgi:hypothetical protein